MDAVVLPAIRAAAAAGGKEWRPAACCAAALLQNLASSVVGRRALAEQGTVLDDVLEGLVAGLESESLAAPLATPLAVEGSASDEEEALGEPRRHLTAALYLLLRHPATHASAICTSGCRIFSLIPRPPLPTPTTASRRPKPRRRASSRACKRC